MEFTISTTTLQPSCRVVNRVVARLLQPSYFYMGIKANMFVYAKSLPERKILATRKKLY